MARHKEFSDSEKKNIANLLKKNLGPQYLKVRDGFGCLNFTYAEGWMVIDLANRIFGFDGWSSRVKGFTLDYCDVSADGKVAVGYSCCCRVTLKNGTYKEDVGFGSAENQRIKGTAIEKAKKEAATDALKRALRLYGNALGNCLYNKSFLESIKNVHKPKKRRYATECVLSSADFVGSPEKSDEGDPSFDNSILGISNITNTGSE
ncbi:DNA repair and recombination protein RAD52 [Pancytospora epiphaga]|nr:DNA repair and recombination protein RAD52 [Pancytospora epiphaga]